MSSRNDGPLKRSDFIAGTNRGVVEGRQARSRETSDRIVDAAIAIANGRDFTDIPVAELCEAADVSPSSFYARFRDRDALLAVVHERHLEVMLDAVAEGMGTVDWASLTLHQLVVRFCELFVANGRQHEGLIRSMQRTEVGRADLRDRRIAFERSGLDLMVALLAERHDEFDAEQSRRVRVAWASLFATLREVLGVMEKADVIGLPEPVLFGELADQFCRYVDLDGSAPRG